MNNELTSIIIPSRIGPSDPNDPPEIQKLKKALPSMTVDDLFANARGQIEVILMLDNCWPDPLPKENKNLRIVHKGQATGMRDSINRGIALSNGKYIMKCDDHCSFAEGFDEVLKKHHEGNNWITIPARYSLDPIKWERTRGPICYLYLTFPFDCHELFGTGFHGSKWHGEKGLYGSYWHLENARRRQKIDDLMIFQGSCYFMTKKHWEFMEGLDEENHYIMYDEAIELDFKTWLSGGRVIINKNTWYSHLHKGKTYKTDFGLSKRHKIMSEVYNVDYWMHNRWPKQTRPLKWLIDHFSPLDGWPENWEDFDKYFKTWKHRDLYKELWGKEQP
jgi:glycosyltransferase involved in cell wall biosynthesis